MNKYYPKSVKFPELRQADPISSTANVTVEKLSVSRELFPVILEILISYD